MRIPDVPAIVNFEPGRHVVTVAIFQLLEKEHRGDDSRERIFV
jgi:hypothetical protein